MDHLAVPHRQQKGQLVLPKALVPVTTVGEIIGRSLILQLYDHGSNASSGTHCCLCGSIVAKAIAAGCLTFLQH